MKYITLLLLTTALIISCSNEDEKILNKADYENYLKTENSQEIAKAEKELSFWNERIKKDSIQLIELSKSAGMQTKIFQLNASIEQLKNAEKNLTRSALVTNIGKDGKLLALAQNYITQHRFKEAKTLVDSARIVAGGEIKAINLVAFDVAMELGDYENAEKILTKETDFSDYNYLIRLGKLEDYKGNLDKTIQHMEAAKAIAESSKQKGLQVWVYTNLADYYGHAGRINDAYNHYLKALAIDPSNTYAKKGIAWIAYSYENNPTEALRIIEAIERDSKSPDYELLKSEIYESTGDEDKAKEALNNFLSRVSNPNYGDMYGAYLVEIYAGNPETSQQAITIAQKEVNNRPTPMSYDLLAHAYYGNGDYKKALSITQEHVIGKTHEPMAQFHTAQIYKALDMKNELAPIKEELLETSFELGPVTYKEIQNL
ncbi:cell surface protein [Dokdonia sp. Dokd-P16]|uniref:tetratricopeptide repeat protein n=1 Tax=Dokdonia sp. Dokd-P16 TaxID=2173169 RepID=UPI000D5436EA|nr:tetratricopeptide repeat protein [Dokdonia sp. Dokd-P16]AWH73034.1 cell surface protein [Dokdonia sp. Dokd-P16]